MMKITGWTLLGVVGLVLLFFYFAFGGLLLVGLATREWDIAAVGATCLVCVVLISAIPVWWLTGRIMKDEEAQTGEGVDGAASTIGTGNDGTLGRSFVEEDDGTARG